MFSCILSFDDMPLVLSSYKLRFGTQVPVATTCDFQQYGILTSVDSDQSV